MVYVITSLDHDQVSAARLAELVRHHWAIWGYLPLAGANRVHHVRDVTFREDASQVRTGTTPRVMATLRNITIGLLCRAGMGSITAGTRRLAYRTDRLLTILDTGGTIQVTKASTMN